MGEIQKSFLGEALERKLLKLERREYRWVSDLIFYISKEHKIAIHQVYVSGTAEYKNIFYSLKEDYADTFAIGTPLSLSDAINWIGKSRLSRLILFHLDEFSDYDSLF